MEDRLTSQALQVTSRSRSASIPASGRPRRLACAHDEERHRHPYGSSLARREAELAAWLREQAPVAIGFSGGVDSAYLAVAARQTLGPDRVLAIIGRSASYPAEQWAAARDVARRSTCRCSSSTPPSWTTRATPRTRATAATSARRSSGASSCRVARERGFATVVDGTNADDLGDYRPGRAGGARARRREPARRARLHEGGHPRMRRARSAFRPGSSRRRPASRRAFRMAPRSRRSGSRRSSAPKRRCATSASPATCACDTTTSSRASSSRRTS